MVLVAGLAQSGASAGLVAKAWLPVIQLSQSHCRRPPALAREDANQQLTDRVFEIAKNFPNENKTSHG